MPEYKTRLTDYRYGGHSAVSDDRGKPAAGDVQPTSHDNMPTQPYVPSGANEPMGVERYGMYGVAPGTVSPETSDGLRVLPAPMPGQYDGDGVRTALPASEARLRERLEMQLSDIVDPGVVQADLHDGVCTLRGTVRDLAMKRRVELVAGDCLPDCLIRNELRAASDPAPARES
ncbi:MULTISPECIES: BON domain-containing protein [Cupriavidus]|uniref:BON domain-containing protein n=1 Tax=Cupriavidus pinatubonensis (strain JMP 134 / LMG 1197) TaxID=264198 RepID=Q475E7_CUPPJ|nr:MULTISPECIES: BON domain-containing protein [Cupriavidus]QYY32198.1 BON domain-containing protein [Cupriavidus pinatubonensis]TPQ36691.1 hypothetical protein C2U69_18160 [Cupriavidus pinatubonensis]